MAHSRWRKSPVKCTINVWAKSFVGDVFNWMCESQAKKMVKDSMKQRRRDAYTERVHRHTRFHNVTLRYKIETSFNKGSFHRARTVLKWFFIAQTTSVCITFACNIHGARSVTRHLANTVPFSLLKAKIILDDWFLTII